MESSHGHRITKFEYESLVNSIDVGEFEELFKENSNSFMCSKYGITMNTLYKLVKDLDICLTEEEKKHRNYCASKQHVMEKYGVENNFQREDVKKKIEETCLEKYGCNYASQSEEVKKKIANTCVERYGVASYAGTNEFKHAVRETVLKKYGVDNIGKSAYAQRKCSETCMKKYGSNRILGNKEWRGRQKEETLEKYGVEFHSQRQDVKDKIKDTCNKLYGVDYYCMHDNCRRSSGANSKINSYFRDLLESCDVNIDCQEFVIGKYQYDFKIGDYLLEINPSATHNSSWSIYNGASPKEIDYHMKKSVEAQKHGYRCVCIWDWMSVTDMLDIVIGLKNSTIQKDVHFNKPLRVIYDIKHDDILSMDYSTHVPEFSNKDIVVIFDDGVISGNF